MRTVRCSGRLGWGGGGLCLGGVYLGGVLPHGQNSWYALVKILPCPKLRLLAVIIYFLARLFQELRVPAVRRVHGRHAGLLDDVRERDQPRENAEGIPHHESPDPVSRLSQGLLPPANEVWGKVMFLPLSVSHSIHRGVCLISCWDTHPHPRQIPPPRQTTPTPRQTQPPSLGCYGIRCQQAGGTHHTCFIKIHCRTTFERLPSLQNSKQLSRVQHYIFRCVGQLPPINGQKIVGCSREVVL